MFNNLPHYKKVTNDKKHRFDQNIATEQSTFLMSKVVLFVLCNSSDGSTKLKILRTEMSCVIVPLKTFPRSHLVVHFSFSEQNLGQLHFLAVLMSEKTSQACSGLNILFLVKLNNNLFCFMQRS